VRPDQLVAAVCLRSAQPRGVKPEAPRFRAPSRKAAESVQPLVPCEQVSAVRRT
jgi:hypothetical protein